MNLLWRGLIIEDNHRITEGYQELEGPDYERILEETDEESVDSLGDQVLDYFDAIGTEAVENVFGSETKRMLEAYKNGEDRVEVDKQQVIDEIGYVSAGNGISIGNGDVGVPATEETLYETFTPGSRQYSDQNFEFDQENDQRGLKSAALAAGALVFVSGCAAPGLGEDTGTDQGINHTHTPPGEDIPDVETHEETSEHYNTTEHVAGTHVHESIADSYGTLSEDSQLQLDQVIDLESGEWYDENSNNNVSVEGFVENASQLEENGLLDYVLNETSGELSQDAYNQALDLSDNSNMDISTKQQAMQIGSEMGYENTSSLVQAAEHIDDRDTSHRFVEEFGNGNITAEEAHNLSIAAQGFEDSGLVEKYIEGDMSDEEAFFLANEVVNAQNATTFNSSELNETGNMTEADIVSSVDPGDIQNGSIYVKTVNGTEVLDIGDLDEDWDDDGLSNLRELETTEEPLEYNQLVNMSLNNSQDLTDDEIQYLTWFEENGGSSNQHIVELADEVNNETSEQFMSHIINNSAEIIETSNKDVSEVETQDKIIASSPVENVSDIVNRTHEMNQGYNQLDDSERDRVVKDIVDTQLDIWRAIEVSEIAEREQELGDSDNGHEEDQIYPIKIRDYNWEVLDPAEWASEERADNIDDDDFTDVVETDLEEGEYGQPNKEPFEHDNRRTSSSSDNDDNDDGGDGPDFGGGVG